jgi:cell division protein FtsB
MVMEKKIEGAKDQNLRLQHENHALQHDRIYVERKARDVLNVGRPGETIFQFPQYSTPQTTTAKN